MCGIIGYIGKNAAVPILLDGLRRLEYRGYDSSGIAVLNNGEISVRKRCGRISNLAELIIESPAEGTVGISHTRWATHGSVTDANAHPHFDKSGKLSLVHNGVIENYATLRDQLVGQGHVFLSQTDTEVLATSLGSITRRWGAKLPRGGCSKRCAWRSNKWWARMVLCSCTATCRTS
jgi:glutamine---fructose-6-phosphate transaminase (isomerizing)